MLGRRQRAAASSHGERWAHGLSGDERSGKRAAVSQLCAAAKLLPKPLSLWLHLFWTEGACRRVYYCRVAKLWQGTC